MIQIGPLASRGHPVAIALWKSRDGVVSRTGDSGEGFLRALNRNPGLTQDAPAEEAVRQLRQEGMDRPHICVESTSQPARRFYSDLGWIERPERLIFPIRLQEGCLELNHRFMA
jgi:hypothetical protein